MSVWGVPVYRIYFGVHIFIQCLHVRVWVFGFIYLECSWNTLLSTSKSNIRFWQLPADGFLGEAGAQNAAEAITKFLELHPDMYDIDVYIERS